MQSVNRVTSIVIAGLGGQGVLKASDIVAGAAFRAGFDVKKSEVHGMSQRGGSVASDVRFGARVFSPMAPAGEADFLVLTAGDQLDMNLARLRDGGVLIHPSMLDEKALRSRRSLNVALLGILSTHLDIPLSYWLDAIRENLAGHLQESNLEAFSIGRSPGGK